MTMFQEWPTGCKDMSGQVCRKCLSGSRNEGARKQYFFMFEFVVGEANDIVLAI